MDSATTPPNLTFEHTDCFDTVVDSIKAELSTLEWLDESLGRIYPQWKGTKVEPWIYKDNGEYYPAFPNDNLTSFSAIYPHNDESYEDNGIWASRTMSVIVWLNLKALEIHTPTVEKHKQDIRRLLFELDSVNSVDRSFDQSEVGAAGIYPGFDVTNFKERFLTYPYAGFRMELTTKYADICL